MDYDLLSGYAPWLTQATQPSAAPPPAAGGNNDVSGLIQRMIAERGQPQQSAGQFGGLPQMALAGLAGYASRAQGPGWGAVAGLAGGAHSAMKNREGRTDEAWKRRMDQLQLMLKLRELNQPNYENVTLPDGRTMTMQMTPQGPQPIDTSGINLPPAQPEFEDVNKYVKAYEGTAEYKKYGEALPIFESMMETQGNDDRMSDLNLVYGLAKVMDPGSVVREGEQVIIRDASSLTDQLQGEIARLNGGASLLPGTRRNLLRETRSRVLQYQKAAKKTYERYSRQGQRYSFPVEDIETAFPELPEISVQPFGGSAPPAVGAAPPTEQRAGAAAVPAMRSGRYRYDPQTKRFVPAGG